MTSWCSGASGSHSRGPSDVPSDGIGRESPERLAALVKMATAASEALLSCASAVKPATLATAHAFRGSSESAAAAAAAQARVKGERDDCHIEAAGALAYANLSASQVVRCSTREVGRCLCAGNSRDERLAYAVRVSLEMSSPPGGFPSKATRAVGGMSSHPCQDDSSCGANQESQGSRLPVWIGCTSGVAELASGFRHLRECTEADRSCQERIRVRRPFPIQGYHWHRR
jgi:hypothetical protein